MINFNDNENTVRTALNNNAEYVSFVSTGNPVGRIFIRVGNGHIVLFHNNDDTFVSYLLPDELYFYHNNIDDIRRIASWIQTFAMADYHRNNP